MCGISAVLEGQRPGEVPHLLERMHRPIPHRGPDGEGFLLVEPRAAARRLGSAGELGGEALAGLAFRRLKILDLSEAAAQPMASPDGRLWIVFNGEIYNFRQLRAELEAEGRRFATSGDTEVALAAFEAWGERAFERMDGMWAIVLVDLARRRLVASRDRFGIKPLFWRREEGRLLLASEVKQIVGVAGVSPRAHAPTVAKFLRGGRYPAGDETFFEEIRSVPPGTWFEVPLDTPNASDPDFRSYWSLAEGIAAVPPPSSYGEALETFRALFAGAVRSHHVADVTVGSLLSGGLDSSTLSSFLAELLRAEGRECPTFSFGFRERAPDVCELRYVDAMVRRENLVNFETSFDAHWVVDNAGRVIHALDEPPLGLPALAQYRVFELARKKGATVVFDGEGSDEILGGYPYHQRLLLMDRLRRRRFGEFGREFAAIARRERRSRLAVLSDFFGAPLLRRLAPKGPRWVAPGYGAGAAAAARPRDIGGPKPGLVDRRLFFDLYRGNVPLVLGYTDRSSMAHSVEARVPFFDRRLVEFASSLPDVFKVGAGQRKRILRDVARDRVPPEITERSDRMGFGTPDSDILRAEWPAFRLRILAAGFPESPCFVPGAVRGLVSNFESGQLRDTRRIWRLYALATWCAEFDVVL